MSIQAISIPSVALPATQSPTTKIAEPFTMAQVGTQTPVSESQLEEAVSRINQTMQTISPGLEFSIDQESQRTIVRIVDQQTRELIRQLPSAETLEIAKALDRVQGLLISLRA